MPWISKRELDHIKSRLGYCELELDRQNKKAMGIAHSTKMPVNKGLLVDYVECAEVLASLITHLGLAAHKEPDPAQPPPKVKFHRTDLNAAGIFPQKPPPKTRSFW